MSMKFTVTQVAKICDRSRNEVVRWINSGWLKAEKLNSDSRNSLYYINEEDLRAFMFSDHYTGHPSDIKASRPFTRVPNIEDCYPINLAACVMGVKLDNDSDEMPYDIWKIDFVRLKELVTHLTDKEQKVIGLRFRIGMTLDECAAAMGGKSKERIRVLEVCGLRKLRMAINYEQCFMVSKKEYDDALKQIYYLNDKINKIYTQEGVLPNEEDKKEELLKRLDDISIADLGLSVRSFNCLLRYFRVTDIYDLSIGQLIRFDQSQENGRTWWHIRNLGRKSLEEIATKIFVKCGYRLQEYDEKEEKYTGFIDIPGVPQTLT